MKKTDLTQIKQLTASELANTRELMLGLEWETPEVYAHFLAQTFHYASYSTRIIGLAGCHFDYSQNDLHVKFMDHVREERGHEKILITDMQVLDYKLEQFPASPFSLTLFQNQYYWIQNVSPMAVYGYFLYLEGIAVDICPKFFGRLKENYPAQAIKYLKLHIEEDVGHVDSHYKYIEKSTPAEMNAIYQNIQQTAFLYRGMLSDIAAASATKARRTS